MTTVEKTLGEGIPQPAEPQPIEIPLSMGWNLLVAIGCVLLSLTIFRIDDFARLGDPVKVFVALLALVPAVALVVSSLLLYQRKAGGRYIALAVHYVVFVLSIVGVLHFWGFFLSFEALVDAVMQNLPLTLGFAVAYGIFWLSNRLEDGGRAQNILTQVAMLLAAGTLILLIIQTNLLGAANAVLDAYSLPLTWVLTIAAVISGVLAWRLLHLGNYFGERPDDRAAWQGWLMLSPNIIGFALFFAGPLLLSFYFSFTDGQIGQIPEVIGITNYAEILSLEAVWLDDPEANPQSALSFGFSALGTLQLGERELVIGARDARFWISMRNTMLFCLMLVPLSVIPALGLSMVLNSKLPGVKFFRAVYFLPSVAAVVGTALIWRWLYDPTIGFFNYILGQVAGFFGLAEPGINWLTDPAVVLFSIVFLAAWQVVGFNTVLFLAGLQGIPNTLYEAAQIDGANRWQQFLNVTLPMLAPTTFFVIITTVIQGLQVFNEPYALFPARPIPLNATTAVYYMYDRAFPGFEYGYSSSVAWILFAVIFLITLAQFRVQRSSAYE